MTIPKPLLPLGDVPILEVVLAQLAAAGISRVVLTLGHMSHLFRALLGDGAQVRVVSGVLFRRSNPREPPDRFGSYPTWRMISSS